LFVSVKDERVTIEVVLMVKIHVDTDLGGDMDDLCALAMLFKWQGVEITGITTVAEIQGKRAGYARYALELAGREGISVAAGADASEGYYRDWPTPQNDADYWWEGIPAFPTPVDVALDLLESSIQQGAIIVGIGPYTNLALLEKRSPGILRDAKLFLMGGYIFPPREGFPQWGNDSDYNIQVDVESAYYVLQHANPTLIPLTMTVETALRRAYLPALQQADALGQLIAGQAEACAIDEQKETRIGLKYDMLPDDLINFQHDSLACAIALGWSQGVEISELPLKFEAKDGWLREIVDEGGRATRVVTRIDGKAFNEFWLRTVTGNRRSSVF
jgi:purine nucleosidase